MRRLVLLVLVIQPFVAKTQESDGILAIMRFVGVTSPEDLDPYDVERLENLLHDPLRINEICRSDLADSGLFNQFQIASLVDYRSRHGAVRSFTELAAIDGFSQDVVQTIAPFISLGSRSPSGLSARPLSQDLAVRSAYKHNSDHLYMYGAKYRMSSEKILLGLSVSKPYDISGHVPEYLSGNLSWNHSSGKVIIGDFNARFGQGLCLWNSAMFSSPSLPSAYMRKPTGFSAANSFSGSMALTGLASDILSGHWKLSAMLALPGVKTFTDVRLMPALNIARYGRSGHISLTHLMAFSNVFSPDYRIPQMITSLDGATCVSGVNIFGESAFDWVNKTVAAVCGSDFMATEWLRMAVLLKYYPSEGFSNEYGAAASGECRWGRWEGNFSIEGSYFPEPRSKTTPVCCQVKAQTEWTYRFTDGFTMDLRVKERYRTWELPYKTDVRIGAQYKSGPATVVTRINALLCDDIAILGYVEGGYAFERMSAYLRLGLFKVDDWDDRIYVYERDAPGNFNVPAYYGRGIWTAAYISARPVRWLKIYFRVSYISYVLMPEEKRKLGKAELKVQCMIRL